MPISTPTPFSEAPPTRALLPQKGPRVPGAPPLEARPEVRSAGGVEHAAGADAAEEAALAEGARVAAGGRWRLAAVTGGHARGRRRGPGPCHVLHQSLSLRGNAGAARAIHVRPTCPHPCLGTPQTRRPHLLSTARSTHAHRAP